MASQGGRAADGIGTSYDRISAAYDLIADRAEARARARGLEVLRVQPGERVLEIGAGTGRALAGVAEAANGGGEVCGLDVSSGMLRIARRRIGRAPRRVDLVRADARHVPFRAAVFDAVFMSFTLELFEDPDIERVLAETSRVLRPGGRIVVVCLASTDRSGPVASAYAWLHRQLPHLLDCRPIPIRRWLARGGFQPRHFEAMALWRLPVAVVAAEAGGRPRREGLAGGA